MKALFLAGVVLAGVLSSGAAAADTPCQAPVQNWLPRDTLRQQLEQQGVLVQRIKVDDGCYEVRGIDVHGNRFKATYAPESLRLRKLKVKNDPPGWQRHGRGKDDKDDR